MGAVTIFEDSFRLQIWISEININAVDRGVIKVVRQHDDLFGLATVPRSKIVSIIAPHTTSTAVIVIAIAVIIIVVVAVGLAIVMWFRRWRFHNSLGAVIDKVPRLVADLAHITIWWG